MIFVVGTNVPMKRVSKLFEMLSRQVLAIAYIRKATTTIDYYGTHNRQFGKNQVVRIVRNLFTAD